MVSPRETCLAVVVSVQRSVQIWLKGLSGSERIFDWV